MCQVRQGKRRSFSLNSTGVTMLPIEVTFLEDTQFNPIEKIKRTYVPNVPNAPNVRT